VTSDARDESGEALRAAAAALGQDLGPAALADAVASLAASLPDVGTVVGDYRLGPVVGRGGMGVVRQAEQVSVPGRKVAVKLLPGAGLSPVARQRFAREVEVIGRLDHPHIVPILSSDVHGSVPYFAMKFVAGTSLRDLVRDGSLRGEWRTIAALVRDLAAALAHAHSHGVVHRDVKPGNVIVDGDGRAMLLDFGLASLAEGADLTMSTDSLGTLDYMAPEQIDRTAGTVGPRTDVYGLGVTLFECLCGRAPFAESSRQATLARILRGDAPSPRILAPAVPRDLATICSKAMRARSEERYADAGAFAADLDAFLAHRAIAARPRSWVASAWSVLRRNRLAATGAVVAVVALTAVVAWFAWLQPARIVAGKLRAAGELAHEHATVAAAAQALAAELQAARELRPGIVLDRAFDAEERRLRDLYATADRLAGALEDVVEQCLSLAPEHRQAHERHADLLAARLRDLLAGGGVVLRHDAVARTQERLRRADRAGRHAVLLDDTARLHVGCEQGIARVVLCPAVVDPDGCSRWAAPDDARSVVLAGTPGTARVAEGSWLLHATLPAHGPIRLPLLVRRGAVASPDEHRIDLAFPAVDDGDGGFLPVHAGFGVVTGDASAPGGARDTLAWHDAFTIQDRELRLADWLRWSGEAPTADEQAELAAGRTLLPAPDWNRVVHVLGRLNEREARLGSGRYVTLPTPAQWRRAGQGADGRPWPWGFVHDVRFSRNYWSVADTRQDLSFRASPEQDVSPFSIHELAGSLREVCLPANALRSLGTRQFVLCGGSTFSVQPADLALTNERTMVHGDTIHDVGLRLVRAPLPAVPDGPARLDLADVTAARLRLVAVRGPLHEELPVDERVRWQDGRLVVDGYGGSFSPELVAWLPVRLSPARAAVAMEFTTRCVRASERGHVAVVLGTQPGFDAHDERLAVRLLRTALLVVHRDAVIASAAMPDRAEGAVLRLQIEPHGDGAVATLDCDGERVARLPFAFPAATPVQWRHVALRLPTFVGMTVELRALRVEER